MPKYTFTITQITGPYGNKYSLLTANEYPWMNCQVIPTPPDRKDEIMELHDKFPELSEKAIAVLDVINANSSFNAAMIGEQVGLSERQVKTYITKLKQAGLIVRVGSNKTGYWKVTI